MLDLAQRWLPQPTVLHPFSDARFAATHPRRTGCANERPSGSVRGVPGNWYPYRGRQFSEEVLDAPYTRRDHL